MPFHVEVSSPLHHARVFNIGDAELQQILRAWIAGQTVELGEQEWEPQESRLKILEGKALEGPDLAFGQGWSNALRSAEDVTRGMLEAEEVRAPQAPVVAIEANSLDDALAGLVEAVPQPLEWREARERIDGRDPAVAAVVVVLRPSGPEQNRS
ncbi:MAG TPA: hypothetical protein VGC63_08440 [Solirubrobacterales bacterium]|jgi:hypothetical protein